MTRQILLGVAALTLAACGGKGSSGASSTTSSGSGGPCNGMPCTPTKLWTGPSEDVVLALAADSQNLFTSPTRVLAPAWRSARSATATRPRSTPIRCAWR